MTYWIRNTAYGDQDVDRHQGLGKAPAQCVDCHDSMHRYNNVSGVPRVLSFWGQEDGMSMNQSLERMHDASEPGD